MLKLVTSGMLQPPSSVSLHNLHPHMSLCMCVLRTLSYIPAAISHISISACCDQSMQLHVVVLSPLLAALAANHKQSATCRVQVLAEAETEELNFILLNINCSALAEVVSRPTMDMLTGSDQRLPELHVLARSVLHAIYSVDHVTLTVYASVEQELFSLKSRHRPSAT